MYNNDLAFKQWPESRGFGTTNTQPQPKLIMIMMLYYTTLILTKMYMLQTE